jgi:SNF2 family DNA or RNA helicase
VKANDLPYQPLITDRILEQKRTNIWVPMGFGKTRAALKAVDTLQLVEDSPTLVLAPYRVANSTWPDESQRWDDTSHLTVTPILGTPEERKRALRADTALFSINDENIPWLVEQFAGRPWPFRTVIRDESTRFKGHRLKQGNKRSQAIGKLAHTQIDRWVNLTGTPSPNGLRDLWGQNWFVDQGRRLGRSFDAFSMRWFSTYQESKPTKDRRWTFKVPVTRPLDHAEREIHAILADVCMSLDPKDWFDLKEPVVREIRVDLPSKARQLYRDMEKKMFMELDGIGVEAVNAAGKSIKCLQIASGFAFVDGEGDWRGIHDAKLDALESIIEEAAGASVLVGYWFKPSLERLRKAFPQGRVLDKDPQTIRDWNAGRIPLLFAHPQSCGHGLNMAEGGHIIAMYESWWDLESWLQILERIGPVRQAQLGPGKEQVVMIYPIIADRTIDEVVQERHRTKRSTQDLLMAYMKRNR